MTKPVGLLNLRLSYLSHRNLEGMARNHAVQHRPSRESKQVELKNELQELRTQNQKLRRENARLRQKTTELYNREGVTEPAELDSVDPVAAPANPNDCLNKCGAGLRVLSMPNGKTIKVCPACKWRIVE